MGLLSTPAPGRLGPACRTAQGGTGHGVEYSPTACAYLANTFTLRVDEKQIDRGRRILTTRATLSNLHNPGRHRCPPTQRPLLDPGWKTLAGVFFAHAGVNAVSSPSEQESGPIGRNQRDLVLILQKNTKRTIAITIPRPIMARFLSSMTTKTSV